jgi:hypothetical protein
MTCTQNQIAIAKMRWRFRTYWKGIDSVQESRFMYRRSNAPQTPRRQLQID